MHENRFQFRGPEKLKDQFSDACDELRIPQNTVFLSLIEFFITLSENDRAALVRRPTSARVTFAKKK